MKHILFSLACVLTLTLNAKVPASQLLNNGVAVDTAKYKITYLLKYKNHPDDADFKEDIRTILIGNKKVKDYSDILFHFDSLRTEDEHKGANSYSNPTGNPWPIEVINDVRNRNADFIYRLPIHSGVLMYNEVSPTFQWEFTDETDTIAGYECSKAITTFGGREYEAWFAPEIPLPYGPYRFCALPGLILKIYDSEKQFIWKVTGIEIFSSPIMVYEYEGVQKCSPQNAYKTIKRAFKTPYSFLSSNGMRLMIRGKEGKFRNSSEIDEPEIPFQPLELDK